MVPQVVILITAIALLIKYLLVVFSRMLSVSHASKSSILLLKACSVSLHFLIQKFNAFTNYRLRANSKFF
jgi:hypothetical protein